MRIVQGAGSQSPETPFIAKNSTSWFSDSSSSPKTARHWHVKAFDPPPREPPPVAALVLDRRDDRQAAVSEKHYRHVLTRWVTSWRLSRCPGVWLNRHRFTHHRRPVISLRLQLDVSYVSSKPFIAAGEPGGRELAPTACGEIGKVNAVVIVGDRPAVPGLALVGGATQPQVLSFAPQMVEGTVAVPRDGLDPSGYLVRVFKRRVPLPCSRWSLLLPALATVGAHGDQIDTLVVLVARC